MSKARKKNRNYLPQDQQSVTYRQQTPKQLKKTMMKKRSKMVRAHSGTWASGLRALPPGKAKAYFGGIRTTTRVPQMMQIRLNGTSTWAISCEIQ